MAAYEYRQTRRLMDEHLSQPTYTHADDTYTQETHYQAHKSMDVQTARRPDTATKRFATALPHTILSAVLFLSGMQRFHPKLRTGFAKWWTAGSWSRLS